MKYKNYLLVLLMIILACNCVDRLVLGVVLQGIKKDLHLTDTALGFLSGIAFAAMYSLMGIPIARWADRGNRVTIISSTAAIWSVAVALCGAVTSFWQLLLVRVAVGIGEAGCIPPANSLIADYFSREERPRAAARYMMGLPIALIVGYLVAGALNERFGWRETFVLVGLPGVALALIAWLTLREPRLAKAGASETETLSQPSRPAPGIGAILRLLWCNRTFRNLLFCYALWYFFGYGLLQWQPTFFIRSHGLKSSEVGMWLSLVTGGGSLLGTYLGGEWGARFAPKNERLQLIAVAGMFCFFAVFNVATYLAGSYRVAFTLLAVGQIGGAMAQGPILSTLQTLIVPSMRATALAVLFLFSNLIGMGLGPLATGVLSDALHPWTGDDSLRYALVVLSPGYFWAAWHLLAASRTVTSDMSGIECSGSYVRHEVPSGA